MKTIRAKSLNVSPEILVHLLSMDGTRRIRIEGMPADARLNYDQISFLVESDTFPLIPRHGPFECLDLAVTEIHDPIFHGIPEVSRAQDSIMIGSINAGRSACFGLLSETAAVAAESAIRLALASAYEAGLKAGQECKEKDAAAENQSQRHCGPEFL